MELEGGQEPQSFNPISTSLSISRIVTLEFAERQSSIPRLGDIWVPKSEVSPNHFVRLYIPGVEDLFQEGDRLVRVEHSGSRSRIISWRIWQGQASDWRFQQQSTDEQRFSTFPSDFEPLSPMYEGAQSEFNV